MRKLIINADDFGITKSVSDAIIEIHNNGIISSASLMVSMPGTDYAINLAKNNPKLGVALHFNITEGKSLVGISSLTDNNGLFHGKIPLNRKIAFGKIILKNVSKELEAQFKYIENAGLNLTHIDSHQHIHMNPKIFKLVANFAKEKKLKIRITYPQVLKREKGKIDIIRRFKQYVLQDAANRNAKYANKIGVKTNKSFNSIFDFHPFQFPNIDDYERLISESKSDDHEIMVHPYIMSDELKEIYKEKYQNKLNFFNKGVSEYNTLIKINKSLFKKYINNSFLINYGDL